MINLLLLVSATLSAPYGEGCPTPLERVLDNRHLLASDQCNEAATKVCRFLSDGGDERCDNVELREVGELGSEDFFRTHLQGKNVVVRIKLAVIPLIFHHEFALVYRGANGREGEVGEIYQANSRFTGGFGTAEPFHFTLSDWLNGQGNVAERAGLKTAWQAYAPGKTRMTEARVKEYLNQFWRMYRKFKKGGSYLTARKKDPSTQKKVLTKPQWESRVQQGCEAYAALFGLSCDDVLKKSSKPVPKGQESTLIFEFAIEPLNCGL